MLSERLLQELDKIMKRDFGRKLNRQELVEAASTIVSFFELLAKVEYKNNSQDKNGSSRKSKKVSTLS